MAAWDPGEISAVVNQRANLKIQTNWISEERRRFNPMPYSVRLRALS